jgi:hypothetical protein
VTAALLVGSELTHKTLWDPTILGVLVVISAIGLFCGSVYLLLSTNLGARLGFLVAAACLTGFMVLLSGLWITTATPLNSPRGRLAGWETLEVVGSLDESSIAEVRDIADEGTRVESEEDLAQLRPGVEAALVQPAAEGTEEPEPSEFAEFGRSTDFLTDFEGFETYVVGGGTKELEFPAVWRVLQRKARYAAVQFCPTRVVEPVAGRPPPAPTCEPLADKRFVVMRYDFGSLRQPPWVYFGVSLILFGLSLAGLHWHEQDARARRTAALQPVPSA